MAQESRSVSLGIEPAYIRLPQSKIIVYGIIGVLISCEKIYSSALGPSVMTLRECRVDCPFPDHVIR